MVSGHLRQELRQALLGTAWLVADSPINKKQWRDLSAAKVKETGLTAKAMSEKGNGEELDGSLMLLSDGKGGLAQL